jgi:threonyl-tRNA synthetase
MVHRALYGSVERFFGILIEHYAGNFPLWLAPTQVKILTLTDAQIPPAEELKKTLEAAGLRVELDARPEKIGHKIRETTLQKVPYMVLLGPKDVESGTLAVRLRDGRQMNGVTSAALLKRLTEEVARKKTAPSEEQA